MLELPRVVAVVCGSRDVGVSDGQSTGVQKHLIPYPEREGLPLLIGLCGHCYLGFFHPLAEHPEGLGQLLSIR